MQLTEVIMTSGNVTLSQLDAEGVGTYDSKAWTGGDRPATYRARSPRPPRLIRTYSADPRTGRLVPDGTPGSHRVRYVPVKADVPTRSSVESLEPHDYHMVREQGSYPYATYQELNPDGVYVDKASNHLTNGFMNFNHADLDPSRVWDVRAKLIEKLYSSIAGGSFNASVFASQTKQTIGGIATACETLAKSISLLRRGNFYGAAKRLLGSDDRILNRHPTSTDVSGRWLELQYGWLPLLSDIKDSSELLSNNLDNALSKGLTRKVRGGFSEVYPAAVIQIDGVRTVNYRLQHIARLKPISNLQLAGVTDPLSVVWENVPYSFVADWFYPVGDYLSALNHSQALEGSFVTTERIRSKSTMTKYKGTTWRTIPQGECFRQTTVLDRRVSQSLQIGIPPLNLSYGINSLTRAANAASLLLQSFSNRRS